MLHSYSIRMLLVCLLLIIAASGCTEEQTADEEDASLSSGVSVSITMRDGDSAQPALVDPPDEEPATPDTSVLTADASAGPQTAGELVDGLQLDDIRWGDHGDYYRIVFDLSRTGGETVTEAPYAETIMSPDGKEIEITLGGIRGISGQPNAVAEDLPVDDPLVTSIERQLAMDDQALVYRIYLAESSTYVLGSLGHPGRVIIDIYR